MRTSFRMIGFSLFLASSAFASGAEKARAFEPVSATCGCKGAGDCTCPRGKCNCKGCGHNNAAQKLFAPLQGSTETTRLPDTARREDARGGTLI